MSVVVAWCDPGHVLGSFTKDLVGLISTGALNGEIRSWIRLEHGPVLDLARNKLTEEFLRGDGEWLLMLDTDMGFPPDLVTRLLQTADPVERPVVGGLCFAMSAEQGVYPTAYWLRENRFWLMNEIETAKPFQVDGTGAAVLMIHRSAFERVGEVKLPGRWWDRLFYGTEPVGEDLSFCLRCNLAEVPIWIDPTIPIQHHKLLLPLDRSSWEAYREQKKREAAA